VYGLGTQYTYLDMKGRRLPVWVSEQGVGRGLQPLTVRPLSLGSGKHSSCMWRQVIWDASLEGIANRIALSLLFLHSPVGRPWLCNTER
jgi:hypothetical protein